MFDRVKRSFFCDGAYISLFLELNAEWVAMSESGHSKNKTPVLGSSSLFWV